MGRWSWYRSLDRPYNSFGTPNFVLAKPRKCLPTVSVTCTDDCCLRIDFHLPTSAASRDLLAALPHISTTMFLFILVADMGFCIHVNRKNRRWR
jgi:hypothetical protein